MPTTVIRWRIYCTTENAWTDGWRNETDGEPTGCFTDSGHTVNSNSIQQLERVSDIIESSKISSNNSTSTNLNSNAVFTGVGEDVSKYTSVSVFAHADQPSADDGLELEFSSDNTNWHCVQKRRVDTHTHLTVICAAQYFRIKYTNGASSQTSFSLSSVLNTFNANENPTVSMTEDLAHLTNIPAQRSVITGETLSGMFKNICVSEQHSLYTDIINPTSAFGDLRTIELEPQIELGFKYGINDYLFNQNVVGSGTISRNSAKAKLEVTAANSSCELTSKRVIKYYTGQGLLVRCAGYFSTGVSGSKQFMGWGDSTDGIYIGVNDTNFVCCRLSNGTYNYVTRSNFNIDKLDGSGPSGIVLDYTKGNVYQIQIQWHGFGVIKFFVEDATSGKYILYHIIQYPNQSTDLSLMNPTFPFRTFIENTSYSGTMNMNLASSTIFNEGKIKRLGPIHFTDKTNSNVSQSWSHMITLRNRSSINSITNRSQIYILSIDTANDHTSNSQITIYKNCTLSSASWSNFDTSDSIMEMTTTGTISSYGYKILGSILGPDSSRSIDPDKFEIYLAPGESLTFDTRIISGLDGDITVGITWQEDL